MPLVRGVGVTSRRPTTQVLSWVVGRDLSDGHDGDVDQLGADSEQEVDDHEQRDRDAASTLQLRFAEHHDISDCRGRNHDPAVPETPGQ